MGWEEWDGSQLPCFGNRINLHIFYQDSEWGIKRYWKRVFFIVRILNF
jgi:hypothetical protein